MNKNDKKIRQVQVERRYDLEGPRSQARLRIERDVVTGQATATLVETLDRRFLINDCPIELLREVVRLHDEAGE